MFAARSPLNKYTDSNDIPPIRVVSFCPTYSRTVFTYRINAVLTEQRIEWTKRKKVLKNEAHRWHGEKGKQTNNKNETRKKKKEQKRTDDSALWATQESMHIVIARERPPRNASSEMAQNQIRYFIMHIHQSKSPGTESFIYLFIRLNSKYCAGCRPFGRHTREKLVALVAHCFRSRCLDGFCFASLKHTAIIHISAHSILRLDSATWPYRHDTMHCLAMCGYLFVSAERKEEKNISSLSRYFFPSVSYAFFSSLLISVVATC